MPWVPGLHREGWWPDAQEVPAPAVLGDIMAWRGVRWGQDLVACGSGLPGLLVCVAPDSPGWWWFVKWHTLKTRVSFLSGRPGGEGPWSESSSLAGTGQVSTCGRRPALGGPAELCSRKCWGRWSLRHAESCAHRAGPPQAGPPDAERMVVLTPFQDKDWALATPSSLT